MGFEGVGAHEGEACVVVKEGCELCVCDLGLFHTGDAKLSDKLSSTYQRPQQMGYPATINENLDELDEFALGFGHEDPIQVIIGARLPLTEVAVEMKFILREQ